MTDRNNINYDPVIADLIAKIEEAEKPVREDKRLVNQLCARSGRPPVYLDVDAGRPKGALSFRRDQFYGKGLATAIREYLNMRGPSDKGGMGAATVNEIYDALLAGGFKFEAKDALNAKRGLRIALSKNTQTFHRVPSVPGEDAYGLLDWYPDAKPEKTGDDDSKVPAAKRTRLTKSLDDMTDDELAEIAARKP